ncbi:MAG TPA: TonB-dependent receptor, partial [Sphingomicrobium sp.]
QRCNAGEAVFCSQLDFAGPNGGLSQIRTFPRNLASQKVSGLDFQIDHQLPIGGGTLSSRALANYMLSQSQVALGVRTNYDGAIGGDSPVQGVPKLRITASETYSQGPFSGTVQGRFIGAAKLVDAWGPKDVDDNTVPARFYVDMRASYQLTEEAQIFGAVDNLLNRNPPNVAVSNANAASIFSTPIRGDIYDQLGRAYRLGVRFNF